MKVTKNQRNYPRQVRVYVAATLAFGFFSFTPFDSILAANANGVMSVQQQRQTVTGTVKECQRRADCGCIDHDQRLANRRHYQHRRPIQHRCSSGNGVANKLCEL